MADIRFDEQVLGEPQAWTVSHRGLEYRGEVIVAETPDSRWGQPLGGDSSFRIVLFTVPRRIPSGQIIDPRVAMAVPARAPDPTRKTLNRELSAIRETRERYVTGPEARAIRDAGDTH